jgi:hypothetical protein
MRNQRNDTSRKNGQNLQSRKKGDVTPGELGDCMRDLPGLEDPAGWYVEIPAGFSRPGRYSVSKILPAGRIIFLYPFIQMKKDVPLP